MSSSDTASSDNPLLAFGKALPHAEVPFSDLKPKHVQPAVQALLEQLRLSIEAIENEEQPPTYQNTLAALDAAGESLGVVMEVLAHWEGVDTSEELREVFNRMQPEVSSFCAGIPLRAKLWQRVKSLQSAGGRESWTPTQQRFLQKTVEEFRREGAELDDTGKERLKAISRELSELTSSFGQNVVAATGAYELYIEEDSRLAGLPQSALEQARAAAKEAGKSGFRFTLQAPSLIPVLSYLDDGKLRQQIYEAFESRATVGKHDNSPVLLKILTLRSEQAKMLGFADFADWALNDRMARTGAAARKFVDDLAAKSRNSFEQEQLSLQAYRCELEGPDAAPIERWDASYYAEKQRRALYDFDAEQLRPYFPAKQVVEGLFETAKRLYGVEVRVNSTLSRWHEDVQAYDLHDADGELLASFYADLFPRKTKRDGAWMHPLLSGIIESGSTDRTARLCYPHLALICANVTPPVGDTPALLSHREVETMFHEFGHLLHQCLSKVEVRRFAGANVAWDFVELPSQIMENWCWEKESLDTFARHYQTGETIPQALLDKMKRARTYREATATMRQLGFSTMDLALHTQYEPEKDGDVLDYARAVAQKFSPFELPKNHCMVAAFSHLFSSPVGYAAGYYSYKWAEVLDADAFTRFKAEGIFSPVVGNAFRRTVLERGGSAEPMTLYKDFMGREPSLDALLDRSGMATGSP